MKKITVIALLCCCIILAGCGKATQEVKEEPTEVTAVSTWIVSGTCIRENLLDVDILVMDDLVKNCTEKKKEWSFLDGLWGVYPEYIISNNQILTTVYNNWTPIDGSICEDTEGTKYIATNPTELPWYDTITRIIGRWLLDEIEGKVYPDNIYCSNNDSDCADMIDYGWRTDGQNYFVAWYRWKMTSESKIFYVIDDKVYDPWKSMLGRGIMTESKRNFAGIHDNRIIVKKISAGTLIWDPDTMDVTQLKSNFILKTCEIDL